LEAVTTKAINAKDLEEQLATLKNSSVSDKQNALDNLKSELQDKHMEEIRNLGSSHEESLSNLRLTHETEMSELNSVHDDQIALSGLKIRELLQEMKTGFEKDKQDAVNEAVANATSGRAIEVLELERRLKSESMELSEVKAELKALKSGLKRSEG
jgi:hypothetical protein